MGLIWRDNGQKRANMVKAGSDAQCGKKCASAVTILLYISSSTSRTAWPMTPPYKHGRSDDEAVKERSGRINKYEQATARKQPNTAISTIPSSTVPTPEISAPIIKPDGHDSLAPSRPGHSPQISLHRLQTPPTSVPSPIESVPCRSFTSQSRLGYKERRHDVIATNKEQHQ